MKTVFLSGPYLSGECDEKYKKKMEILAQGKKSPICDKLIKLRIIKNNIKIAIKATQYLRKSGFNVFCPHLAIAGYCQDMNENNKQDRKLIIDMNLQWVEKCDIIAFIPGWQKSKGCREEFRYADDLKKKMRYLTNKEIGL